MLLKRQPQASQNIGTCKNIQFLPTGSTVAVKREDFGPWMHRMRIGYGTDDHNCRISRVRVTKTGHAIIRMKRHIKPTNVSAEDYLLNKMAKASQTMAEDRLNELTDHSTQLHKSDQKKNGRERQGECQKHTTYRAIEQTCICKRHGCNKTG